MVTPRSAFYSGIQCASALISECGGWAMSGWTSSPEGVPELKKSHAPRPRQGFAVFFTGLSGSGKSSLAKMLMAKLLERGDRTITLLDGDIVRTHLSSELGFSREHREINILRVGFVASEIVKHGGIAICALIAPYESVRKKVREMVSAHGGFVEVYVSTPLDVCESRDTKGLYAKARAGLITNFTGISDPYEVPEKPDLVINTQAHTLLESTTMVLRKLETEGYIPE